MELGSTRAHLYGNSISDEDKTKLEQQIGNLNTIGVMGVAIRALTAQAKLLEMQVNRMNTEPLLPPQDTLFAITNSCNSFEIQEWNGETWENVYGYESTNANYSGFGSGEILGWAFIADKIETQATSDGAPLNYAYGPDGKWRCNVTGNSYKINFINTDEVADYGAQVNEDSLMKVSEYKASRDDA